MLNQVTDGVWVHNSEFLQSKSIVVRGRHGLLLIDPGITTGEMVDLAGDVHQLGQPVVAGFSTHPHWDHVLWHANFGEAPRYGTAANAAHIADLLLEADWKSQVARALPPGIGKEIPLDNLFGQISGLLADTRQVPWDGPRVQIFEHQAHAPGHAALLVEERGVLVAGDMLSDILIPFFDLDASDPTEDYLAALALFGDFVDDVKVFVPGHGSIGDRRELRARINRDRAYVHAICEGGGSDDPRLATGPNKVWLPGVHSWQSQQIAGKRERY